ncbi:MAG: hypothetical protein IJJ14_06800, partial [Coriobacteriales bacterium]|nr:hypothetical protein [Coriobacteriales bacterium]
MQRTQEPDQGQGSRPTRSRRDIGVLIIVGILMCAILGMLVYDMVIKGDEYAAQAYDNQLRPIDNEAFRGTILDRNGNILAQS